jgi:hypothetical protein
VTLAPSPATFLSGESGHVAGVRRTVARRAGDRLLDGLVRVTGADRGLERLAARVPAREVLVLGIYRPGGRALPAAARELRASRHRVRLAFGATGRASDELEEATLVDGLAGGKFENLDRVWSAAGRPEADWLLVVDDDVGLPPRFLDRLIGAAERFGLALAQPAQTLMSHAAWRVTRRRAGSLVRETRFVEIGPVTLFSRASAAELLPFPHLRYGWGLDLHWAALAARRGWRLGIVDALPVRHESAPVASAYPYAEAIREAQDFLATRPYVPSAVARSSVRTHFRA